VLNITLADFFINNTVEVLGLSQRLALRYFNVNF